MQGQQRYLPEGELNSSEAEIAAQIYEAEEKIRGLRTQLSVIQYLKTKLVAAPGSMNGGGSEEDDDDDDGTIGPTPTRLILDVLSLRPGQTRDDIYEAVKGRLETTSKNPRNLVVNILNRLEKRYNRIERVGELYYPAGRAPTDYDDFQAPVLEDDDDLPF